MEDRKGAQRRNGKSWVRRTLQAMVGAWLFPEGTREHGKDKTSEAVSLDFSFSKTPSLLPGGEGAGRMGIKSRSRELALHCSHHPNRHWLSGRSDQSSLGWEEGEAGVPSSGSFGSWGPLSPSLAQLVWTLSSLERQGLSVAASQKSEDYRFASGPSLLSHRCPRTLLSLGSEHCIRTPLGRPTQKLTAVRQL